MFQSGKLKTKIFNKGEILLNKGDVCKYGFWVVSGCLISYIIDNEDKKHILQFAPEDWFVSDVESFVYGSKSATYIEAIEKTEVKLFPKILLENLNDLGKNELWKQNQKLIRNIISINRRLASILGSSAEERYLEFCQTYPTLLNRLPLKLIASYIGITPEYLSEIRRKPIK